MLVVTVCDCTVPVCSTGVVSVLVVIVCDCIVPEYSTGVVVVLVVTVRLHCA